MVEKPHYHIECWRDGQGRLYWRELTRDETFEVRAIECSQYYHFNGDTARVSCYVYRSGGSVGRSGAIICAESRVKGTGTTYTIDLDF